MVRPSPARDRVLRTLLTAAAKNMPRQAGRPKVTSLYSLAQLSGASFPWVHEIMHGLAADGFVELQPELRVKDAAGLFAWWRKNSVKPEIKSFHVPDPIAELASIASKAKAAYAITTYYAENRFQAHLFPRRLDVYIRPQDLKSMRVALLASGAQLGGTNFRLWIRDEHLPGESFTIGTGKAALSYAPVAQVILDLYLEGASAAEAADMLVEKSYA
ncbi:MAG: hypothetical protein AABY18_03010 [Candidatus Thermoplasmatota archaeon]